MKTRIIKKTKKDYKGKVIKNWYEAQSYESFLENYFKIQTIVIIILLIICSIILEQYERVIFILLAILFLVSLILGSKKRWTSYNLEFSSKQEAEDYLKYGNETSISEEVVK